MKSLSQLEKRIVNIENRNKKVEADKAWETSSTRKILLTFFTYFSIGTYMAVINVNQPWLNAIVPSIGFMLPTLTLHYFKNFWLKNRYSQ